MKTASVTTTRTTAALTTLMDNVIPVKPPHIPLTIATIWAGCYAMAIAITKHRNAETGLHVTGIAHAFVIVQVPKRPALAQISAHIMTSTSDDVSTIRRTVVVTIR